MDSAGACPASGAGRSDLVASGGSLPSGFVVHASECWDATFARVYYTEDVDPSGARHVALGHRARSRNAAKPESDFQRTPSVGRNQGSPLCPPPDPATRRRLP